MLKRHIVFFVTHQYEFAHRFHDGYRERTLLCGPKDRLTGSAVQAETWEPLQTSYGPDLYQTIFKGMTRSKGSDMPEFVWIGIGGFVGANLRYLVQT